MKELTFEEKIECLDKLIKSNYLSVGICYAFKKSTKYKAKQFPELFDAIFYYSNYRGERPFKMNGFAWLWRNQRNNNNRIDFLNNIKAMLINEHKLGNV